jgi:hypothetical protein
MSQEMSKVQIQWQVNWSCFVYCRPLLVIRINPPLFPPYFTLLYSFHVFHLSLGLSASSCTQLLSKQRLLAAESNVPSNEIRFESPTALRIKITVFRGLMPCTFVATCVPNCLSAFLLQSTGRQIGGGGEGEGREQQDPQTFCICLPKYRRDNPEA